MEYLLFIAIVMALIEWRDIKQNKRYEAIEKELKASNQVMEMLIAQGGVRVSEEINSLHKEITPFAEFLMKAHTDLATIVQEYELNGIPLHLRRGMPEQQFDAVEGL